MRIVEVSTGGIYPVRIDLVDSEDYQLLSADKYFFDWYAENEQEVYKLSLAENNDILGLVSIERIPNEWRIHIRLLTVSAENKGREKRFDGIAGNLIAHVAKIAVREFGELACISLKPKSQLIDHYIQTYKMNRTGMTLSLEVPEIIDHIIQYDQE